MFCPKDSACAVSGIKISKGEKCLWVALVGLVANDVGAYKLAVEEHKLALEKHNVVQAQEQAVEEALKA